MLSKYHNLLKKHLSPGFTLTEILIVVTIIAILGLLLITTLTKQRTKAQDARIKADLERLRIAFEEYYNDFNCYPPLAWYDDITDCGSENLKPYLAALPCDPKTGEPYVLEYAVSQCDSFKLYGTLSNTDDSILNGFCVPGGSTLGNYGVASTNAVIAIDCAPAPSSSPSPPPGFNDGIYGCQAGTPENVCNDYGSLENAAANCTYSFLENDCQNLCDNPIYFCN